MLKNLIKKRLELIFLLFHVILGIVSVTTPYMLVVWMLFIMGTSFLGLLLNKNKDDIMTYTLAYLLGVEVFSRVCRAPLTGLLPDEIGKYFPLYVLLAAFLVEGKMRKGAGWFIILLTLPSLVLIEEWNLRYGIVFNYLGILNLALLMLYFGTKTITVDKLNNMFKLTIFPLISSLVFITIKTPDFAEIEFGLGANFATSGNYGSNQVSTQLGLGMMIMLYFYVTRQKLFSIQYLDEFLLGMFIFRGLLTFSRGGMMVPMVGIILFYLVLRRARNFKIKGKLLKKIPIKQVLIAVVLGVVVFLVTDNLTGGQLLLRYQGETGGTLAGSKEKTLNTFTTNRVAILEADVALWLENPILGVGPGMSKYLRIEERGFGSHVEYSRLVAEHGLFGFIVVLILTFLPFVYYRKLKNPMHKAVFVLFIFVAIMTSFHAAMRTMVTPFFYGLAFAKFDFD